MRSFMELLGGLLLLAAPAWAARSFDGATQYAELITALRTAPSFTICGWGRPATTTTDGTVLAFTYTVGTTDFFVLNFRPYSATAALRTVRARTSHITAVVATSTGPYTDLAWNHVCGVWGPGTALRGVYLQGANYAQETTTTVPDMPDNLRTSLGRLSHGTPAAYWKGDLADVCVWSVVLSAAEVAGLASGAPCAAIQPTTLLAHVPLWGVASPEQDLAAARTWPLTGSPPATAGGPPVAGRR